MEYNSPIRKKDILPFAALHSLFFSFQKPEFYNQHKHFHYIKNIKIPRNKLNQGSYLYSENQNDTKKWKDFLCSWIGRINTVKMATLPKAIHRSNATPVKILTTFLTELEQTIPEFIRNHKRPQTAKAIFCRSLFFSLSSFCSLSLWFYN